MFPLVLTLSQELRVVSKPAAAGGPDSKQQPGGSEAEGANGQEDSIAAYEHGPVRQSKLGWFLLDPVQQTVFS